jgi:DNA-binding MarR family transcriptional regulator
MGAVRLDEEGVSAGMPSAAPRTGDVDEGVVEDVLTATRALIAISTSSLGALAEDVTTAQYRALVLLASRGPQRMVDLARALGVNPSTAGRLCDRLVGRGWVTRTRTRDDRRSVHVTISHRGRQLLDHVTATRRAMITKALSAVPPEEHEALGRALRALSDAAGEVPDHEWPAAPD